jgi:hypothetical protein
MEPRKGSIGRGLAYQVVAVFAVGASPVLFLVLLQSIVLLWVPLLLFGLGMCLFAFGIKHHVTSGASLVLRVVLVAWPAVLFFGALGVIAVAEKWVPGEDKVVNALEWRMVRTEIFLIPADYRGKVKVTLDDPNGVPPAREGDSVVFRIPSSGQLSTREHSGYAYLGAVNKAIDDRRQFYLVEKSGARTGIPLLETVKVPGQLAIFWDPFGSLAGVGGFLEESRYAFYSFSVQTVTEDNVVR